MVPIGLTRKSVGEVITLKPISETDGALCRCERSDLISRPSKYANQFEKKRVRLYQIVIKQNQNIGK